MNRKLSQVLVVALTASIVTVAPAGPAHADTGHLIKNKATGMCVDVPNYGAPLMGDAVQQWHCDPTPADNQLWILDVRTGTDWNSYKYWIRNVKMFEGSIWNLSKIGPCLDLPNYGTVPAGTKVSMYRCSDDDNQYFRVVHRYALGGYMIIHDLTGLCLDVDGLAGSGGPDARLTLWPCSDTDDHIWNVI